MFTCEKCNQVYAEQVNICAICGHDVIKPVVSEPVFIPVSAVPDTTEYTTAYTTTDTTETSPVPGVSKAKGIVGFVLAIESFASSILIMMYSMVLSALIFGYGDEFTSLYDYGYNSIYPSNDLFVVLFAYLFAAVTEMVLGIVALSLISKAKNSGYTSKLASLGKTFGIIGTVISGVTALILFSAFINM